MIVVADAGPLRYLVLIESANVLVELYGLVFIPPAVMHELTREQTPGAGPPVDFGSSNLARRSRSARIAGFGAVNFGSGRV